MWGHEAWLCDSVDVHVSNACARYHSEQQHVCHMNTHNAFDCAPLGPAKPHTMHPAKIQPAQPALTSSPLHPPPNPRAQAALPDNFLSVWLVATRPLLMEAQPQQVGGQNGSQAFTAAQHGT